MDEKFEHLKEKDNLWAENKLGKEIENDENMEMAEKFRKLEIDTGYIIPSEE